MSADLAGEGMFFSDQGIPGLQYCFDGDIQIFFRYYGGFSGVQGLEDGSAEFDRVGGNGVPGGVFVQQEDEYQQGQTADDREKSVFQEGVFPESRVEQEYAGGNQSGEEQE